MSSPRIDLLYNLSQRDPSSPFLSSASEVLTVNSFLKKVAVVDQQIKHERDSLVALYAARTLDTLVDLQGIWQAGKTAVLVPTHWPHDQIRQQLAALGCHTLLAPQHSNSPPPECRSLSFERPAARQAPLARYRPLYDPATVIFTSGSTARPKAVCHSFANHYYSALGSQRNIAFGPSDCWHLELPLYHIGGLALFMRALFAGGSLFLGRLAEAQSITHVSAVATQMQRWLKESRSVGILQRLKAILLGGSAIPERLIEQCVDQGLAIHTSYGCTEMASQITTTPPHADLSTLKTSGRLLPYRQLALSEQGDIWVKGQPLFMGYLQEGTMDPARNDQGWFKTNDLGQWDENGRLIVRGRLDHVIISGGENISAEEIEQALNRLDIVLQSVVTAVPDATWGQRPVAFIRTPAGIEWHAEVIKQQLKGRLARYKIPDHIWPWPRDLSPAGIKPDRQAFAIAARRLISKAR